MGSGSERLGGSDVGKRGCSSYRSVLSFRGPEAEQEKLESAVLIGDRIRVIREAEAVASVCPRKMRQEEDKVHVLRKLSNNPPHYAGSGLTAAIL